MQKRDLVNLISIQMFQKGANKYKFVIKEASTFAFTHRTQFYARNNAEASRAQLYIDREIGFFFFFLTYWTISTDQAANDFYLSYYPAYV